MSVPSHAADADATRESAASLPTAKRLGGRRSHHTDDPFIIPSDDPVMIHVLEWRYCLKTHWSSHLMVPPDGPAMEQIK
jgi:hypothetical protein